MLLLFEFRNSARAAVQHDYRRPMVAAGLFLIAVAAGCALAFEVIGSHVDDDGWLREPFALIPLGWLSGLAGVSLVVLGLCRRRWGRPRR